MKTVMTPMQKVSYDRVLEKASKLENSITVYTTVEEKVKLRKEQVHLLNRVYHLNHEPINQMITDIVYDIVE